MIQILECLKLSQRFLSLSSFFLSSCVFILFRLNVCFFLLFQIVDLSPGFLLFTVGSLYIFLYCTLYTLPFFLNFATILNHFCEHPITSVLNCASDTLAISSLLSSFFWSFDLFFHLGHISLFRHTCYIVRGRTLGIHLSNPPGCAAALPVGEGSEREQCSSLDRL